MANTVISLRSSDATGNTPSLGVLANGELSLNFADGILYYKTAANALGSIRTTQVAGLNKEIQFNDAGSFGSDASLTFDKANTTLTTNNFVANTITTGTGVGGIIAGANVIYANTFVANTGGYVEFSDGSKQYTANAGSTTLAQAAFDKANTDVTSISATAGVYGNATYVPVITLAANGRISSITNTAISGGETYTLPIASDSVLGGIKVGLGLSINASSGVLDATSSFPLIDLGSVVDTVTAYNILDLGTSF
jgi:hypothetical protein